MAGCRRRDAGLVTTLERDGAGALGGAGNVECGLGERARQGGAGAETDGTTQEAATRDRHCTSRPIVPEISASSSDSPAMAAFSWSRLVSLTCS